MKNSKSDVSAKKAFKLKLESEGFYDVKIVSAPADIMAKKDSKLYFFEIKMTSQSTHYFGGATLTEWEAAIRNSDTFRFVIAKKTNPDNFEFIQFTPEEFMEFSTIPPFKIYFNIDLSDSGKKRKIKSAIQLTKANLQLLSELHLKIKKRD
jgi:hypothetical protein